MRTSTPLLALTAVAGGFAANTSLLNFDNASAFSNNTSSGPILNRYIVEFASGIDPNQAANELANAGATVLKVFDSDVFSGASVLSDTHNLDTLQELAPVARSWQSKKHQLMAPISAQMFSAAALAANFSVHAMTGVDKLHEAGIFGKGVKVAVIDTGVWYPHPALGGGFGPGFKVAGGYDLVGPDWGYNTSVKSPGPDPLDGLGHGTHVSGIIAGQNDRYVGVAPEASLYVYKIFGDYVDGTDEDTIIEAFLMAYKDEADVITSSIGSDSGFSDDPWAVIASRLVEQGVVVTIANGNSGGYGPWSESSGSNGEFVLAVASVQADVVPEASFQATFEYGGSSNTTTIQYQSSVFWDSSPYQGWPIVPFNPDPSAPNTACHTFNNTYNSGSYAGSIVLVTDGPCSWGTMQNVIWSFYDVTVPILISSSSYPTSLLYNGSGDYNIGYIPADVGETMLAALRGGVRVTANFSNTAESLTFQPMPNIFSGGKPDFFSSLGPTNDLNSKPDIAAPGGDIFSTWLNDGWAVLSGTSMATPYIAGVAALYIGQHGGRTIHGPGFAKDLAMRIIASGKSLDWVGGILDTADYAFSAPVIQVGTGLVNASKVLDYHTSLSFTRFVLNDTRNFERSHSIGITNNGPAPVTYTFSLEAGGTINTLVANVDPEGKPVVGVYDQVFPAPYAAVPSVSFPKGTFSVKPGQTKTANIDFMYPSGLNADALPLYSGKVIITGSNGESLAVPYMGLGADLYEDLDSVFEYGSGLPQIISGVGFQSVPITEVSTFSFDYNIFVRSYPTLKVVFDFYTDEFRWDIFDSTWNESHWSYPPVVGKKGYIGAATLFLLGYPVFKPNVSDVAATPFTEIPRGIGVGWPWFGGLANGSQIQPGKYWMRVAALKPFSTQPGLSESWDIYSTPQITVIPNPMNN